jgi:hypothetical protein
VGEGPLKELFFQGYTEVQVALKIALQEVKYGGI